MAGGKLMTTGATFYSRGIPKGFYGFGVLTTINYSVGNNKQTYFQTNSILRKLRK